jgi:Mn2+/Fe2+ NRAMP family transporter
MVAAQSGAKWKYSLLLLQFLLIPVLFCAQELTVRLGVYTQKGHAACIKEHFGSGWAWVTTALLAIECVLAIISEMSGISSVAELWGMNRLVGTVFAALLIMAIVLKCKYKQIEMIAIGLGLAELSFVFTMCCFHPSPAEVFRGMFDLSHIGDGGYQQLVAANIGAVIMPWMIYFQQSAVVARRLTNDELKEEQASTFLGCCLTQLIMIGTLVTFAAAKATSLADVKEMHQALTPVLGSSVAMVMLSLAFIGGALCASFVVSLAASWAICEASGWDDAYSLDRAPSEAPRFYACFSAVLLIGVIVLATGVDVVELNVFIELMDGLMMPFAIGFLYILACSDLLPPNVRVTGTYKATLAVLFTFCSVVSLSTGVHGLVKQWIDGKRA